MSAKTFDICRFDKMKPQEPISDKANTKYSMETIGRPGGELKTCLRDLGPNLGNTVGEIGSEVESSAH